MRFPTSFLGLILFLAFSCSVGSWIDSARAADARSTAQAGEKAVAPALTPPSSKGRADSGKGPAEPQSPVTLVIGLAMVLAIFFVVVWLIRRSLPQGHGPLPPDAFAVLGRAPLGSRQQAQLVRCGNKLLLVCVGATGVQTLTEITDPAEVERLEKVCRGRQARADAAGRGERGLEKNNAG